MRRVSERLYVALSVLALLVAVVSAAVAARPSSADFVATTTSPANSITTLLPLAPSHDPVATRAAGVVRLTWSASATAATHTVTYTVLRRPTGSGAYAQVAGPLSELTYDDTPPADGSYEYVVRTNVSTFTSDDSTARSGLSDRTAPTITGAASPPPNAAGWNNTNVTVTYTCNDGLSGIASCTSPVTLSSDGSGQSSSGTAVDAAGNSAGATVSGIKIDKTPPSAAGSVAGASGQLTDGVTTVNVTWTAASDAISDIARYTLRAMSAAAASACPAPGVGAYETVLANVTSPYVFTGAAATSYCFYVIATNGADLTSISAPTPTAVLAR